MSTPFQEALLEVIAAEREHAAGIEQWRAQAKEAYRQHPDHEQAERRLARACDRLEAEQRRMMREEVSKVIREELEAHEEARESLDGYVW